MALTASPSQLGGGSAECVPGAIGHIPRDELVQEHAEDHPLAHPRGPGIEVWLEARLPRDRSPWVEQ